MERTAKRYHENFFTRIIFGVKISQLKNITDGLSWNAKIGYSQSHLHVTNLSLACCRRFQYRELSRGIGWAVNTLSHNFWPKKGVGG